MFAPNLPFFGIPKIMLPSHKFHIILFFSILPKNTPHVKPHFKISKYFTISQTLPNIEVCTIWNLPGIFSHVGNFYQIYHFLTVRHIFTIYTNFYNFKMFGLRLICAWSAGCNRYKKP